MDRDIRNINIYSDKLFYGAVGLASVFVIIVFAISIGGFNPALGMVLSDTDYPEGASATNPLTEESFANHSSNMPTKYANYRVTHGYQVESVNRGLIDSDWTHYHFSNTEDSQNALATYQSADEFEVTEQQIYETEERMLEYDGTQVSEYDGETVMQNQLVLSVEMAEHIEHINWSASETVETDDGFTAIKYTPGHVDTRDIEYLTTAKSVEGELLIDKETGIILSYSVEIRGSSNETSRADSIVITSEYAFTEAEPLDEPPWVQEFESTGDSEE